MQNVGLYLQYNDGHRHVRKPLASIVLSQPLNIIWR